MEIEAGSIPPWGYGLAYRRFDQDVGVFYPIPLHWIVRHARNVYFWVRFSHNQNFHERKEREIFKAGYDQCKKELSGVNAREQLLRLVEQIDAEAVYCYEDCIVIVFTPSGNLSRPSPNAG